MAKKDYPTKYNYDAAIELILKAAESDGKVTYEELEKAYGLEKPIADKSASSTNMSALYELRQVLKAKHGLTFKSASDASHYGPEYHYYIVSKIKDTTITKKKTEKKENASNSNVIQELTKSCDALSRNNMELYKEKEALKLELDKAKCAMLELENKANKYKDTVNSLLNTVDSLSVLINLK